MNIGPRKSNYINIAIYKDIPTINHIVIHDVNHHSMQHSALPSGNADHIKTIITIF